MRQKGFTLIELLIVVAVIGLLTTVILSSFTASRNKAKNSTIRQELSTIRTQAGVYFNAVGGYGSSSTDGLCSTAMASSSMFNASMGNGADATARIMQRVGELAGDTPLNQLTKTLCYVQNDSYTVAVALNGGEGIFCVDYRNITKFYPGGTGSLDLYAIRDNTSPISPQPFICRP
jgi:prepilin-type N-terminal cleavage/methylation domain-containing protein